MQARSLLVDDWCKCLVDYEVLLLALTPRKVQSNMLRRIIVYEFGSPDRLRTVCRKQK